MLTTRKTDKPIAAFMECVGSKDNYRPTGDYVCLQLFYSEGRANKRIKL